MFQLKHKVLQKLGKTEISQDPEGYAEKRESFVKTDKYLPKLIRTMRTFCERSEALTKVQRELGERLAEIGMNVEPEMAEAMIKIGEGIKSLATIQHAMLVNQVERFIKPNEVYHKTFKVANSAHSRYKNKKLEMDTQEKLIEHLRAKGNVDPKKINDAETTLSKLKYQKEQFYEDANELITEAVIKKQTDHYATVLEIMFSFHHYFSEGYTLTNELKPFLEKCKKECSERKGKLQNQEKERNERRKQMTQIEQPVVVQNEPVNSTTESPSQQDKPKMLKLGGLSSIMNNKKSEKAQPTTTSSSQLARAIYDYETQEEGELSFKAGDTIKILERNDDGWWLGQIGNKQGMFPSNYIEEMAPQGGKSLGTTTAMYDYTAQEEGELSFKEGDVITIYHKHDDGWWEGEVNGKRGSFPANYTKAGQQ